MERVRGAVGVRGHQSKDYGVGVWADYGVGVLNSCSMRVSKMMTMRRHAFGALTFVLFAPRMGRR